MEILKRPNKGKSLLDFPENYVVVDLETTGLSPLYDDIIECSAIRVINGVIVEEFSSLVKTRYRIDPFIENLTGITNGMLAEADPPEVVLPQYYDFIGDDLVLAHNANFDINFLYDKAELVDRTFFNDFIDTLRLSRRLYRDLKNHKLNTVAEYLGVENDQAHRALSDCRCVLGCYQKMKTYASENSISADSFKKLAYNTLSNRISTENSEFDEDSPIFGMTFVFTGKMEKMSRKEAMQAVVDAGGYCKDGVTVYTNYLVLGSMDYCKAIKDGKSSKQKKAEKLQLDGNPIAVISEDVFYDMLAVKDI